MFTTLIESSVLAGRIADGDWAVIDCRFELTQPEWGRNAYEQGHIPGALYAHLDRDLSGPVTPQSGRHP
ncbi:rhodanese-like domain-containing protein, partial [Enterococcus faecium]|uniref:rhodanese-like domain-containing protein n=1 Tax=Enterococcus faecium TaxID=1352 RepID=UPI003F42490E